MTNDPVLEMSEIKKVPLEDVDIMETRYAVFTTEGVWRYELYNTGDLYMVGSRDQIKREDILICVRMQDIEDVLPKPEPPEPDPQGDVVGKAGI